MNDKENGNYKQDLLFRINDNLIRLDEKVKALTEANKKEQGQICEEIKEILNKHEELMKRIDKLELEGVKLSIFWKILVVVGPIVISFVISVLFKLFGVSI